ncbi:hypothetical protein BP6252_04652 [Coleophoma cylindrospora]|uniref:Beta-lactamase-related domain-containing protein n=1 Tax=Coleophoma cylindrospora TaxID=1849047 RepID=A0A3D8S1Q0_9HELO|nr:hypothetical protein BP6252_04652 [Coleophoma cylindrospora]
MATFEAKFQEAIDSQTLGGVVLQASDKTGKFTYAQAFGKQSLQEGSPASKKDVQLDSVFTLASCTKLVTSIAALQCVEQGLIGLDDDVSPVLTELKDAEIIDFPMESSTPKFAKAKSKITLRMLLSHSSGISYDLMSPDLTHWRMSRGEIPGPSGMPMMDRISMPLVFEPGTSWSYGAGLDWAGVLVARLSGGSLEAFMQKHIWSPLGIKDITFHLHERPDLKARHVAMSAREGIANPVTSLGVYKKTGKAVFNDDHLYDDPTVDEFGGQGLYGSVVEYMKVLESLTKNDGKLLTAASVDEMFKPQLPAGGKAAVEGMMNADMLQGTFGMAPKGTSCDWGLGGLLILTDLVTGKKKGTMTWSGLPNLLWTIDREAGLCCFYASQMVPFGDPQSHDYQQLFEKEMYDRLGKVSSGP